MCYVILLLAHMEGSTTQGTGGRVSHGHFIIRRPTKLERRIRGESEKVVSAAEGEKSGCSLSGNVEGFHFHGIRPVYCGGKTARASGTCHIRITESEPGPLQSVNRRSSRREMAVVCD